MITVISATNRPNSNTLKAAKKVAQLIDKKGVNCKLFSFEQLPQSFIFTDLFDRRTENFQQLLNEYIIPTQKLLIIAPEYNGSFPGILKSFLDAIPPAMNRGKKVALIGVSTGRAGNIRGMEHLTGVLNYLGMYVMPNKLPISSFLTLINEMDEIIDEYTLKVLEKHVDELINF